MEVGRRQILLDDPVSDCRSFGSNLRPSSQSRKMSIGILTDSQQNKRSRAIKEGKVTVSNAKRANSNGGDSSEGKGKIIHSNEEKKTPEKVTSPWINTRSFHQKTEAIPTTCTRRKKPGRAQDATITHSVQSFANLLRADGVKQQKFNGITNKRMGSKDGNSQKLEECKLGDSPKKGAVDANEEKQTEASEKVTSPWIGTRSFHKLTTVLPTNSTKRNKPGSAQDATITHSVQSFSNHLHDDGDKLQKFNGITCERMGGKVGNSQKPEEFTFVAAKEVVVSNKPVAEDKKEEDRSESLKKKIQEIFGTVSSPRSQPSIPQVCDVGVNHLKLKQTHHQKGNSGVKPLQNSDTIETDSENPDCTKMRPVTRSLTRIRIATKVRPEKTKTGPLSSHEHNFHEKNIFLFDEGLFEKGDMVSGGSSMSKRKKGMGKNSGIKPRKIYFTKNKIADEIQRATCRNEMPPPAEKESSLSDKTGGFHGCSPHSEDKCSDLSNRNLKGDSHESARENRVDQQGNFTPPFVPMNEDQQEKFANQDMKNVPVSQDETQSPTFKINTPILSSSPSSTLKSDQTGRNVHSPMAADEEFTPGNIYIWRNLQTSKEDLHASNAKLESSDNMGVLEDSPPCKQFPFKRRKEALEDLSESSSEDGDYKSSEEEFKERDGFSLENAMAERLVQPTKRLCNREGNGVSKFNPIWTPEHSEQDQENELERITTLFALALENFRNKLKSATRKKSSEILLSVSEEIHLQLQNVVSQIQTDVGKVIKNSKSKRKHLETRFQEQQDKLKLIYDKFKEDIHQHLQDCETTMQELEMHHIELKGAMKKQKVSHEKLVNKVEETVETQLHDADRRVTAVNKSAKERMLQLQQVIVEFLKEGSLQ